MAAKLPVRQGDTDTVSFMTHGYDPDLASWSPFHGAVYAVLLSLARIMALGGNWRKSYLTLQEYFEKLTDEKAGENRRQPFSELFWCSISWKSAPLGEKIQ